MHFVSGNTFHSHSNFHLVLSCFHCNLHCVLANVGGACRAVIEMGGERGGANQVIRDRFTGWCYGAPGCSIKLQGEKLTAGWYNIIVCKNCVLGIHISLNPFSLEILNQVTFVVHIPSLHVINASPFSLKQEIKKVNFVYHIVLFLTNFCFVLHILFNTLEHFLEKLVLDCFIYYSFTLVGTLSGIKAG